VLYRSFKVSEISVAMNAIYKELTTSALK
jgi:hypothetical protein